MVDAVKWQAAAKQSLAITVLAMCIIGETSQNCKNSKSVSNGYDDAMSILRCSYIFALIHSTWETAVGCRWLYGFRAMNAILEDPVRSTLRNALLMGAIVLVEKRHNEDETCVPFTVAAACACLVCAQIFQ